MITIAFDPPTRALPYPNFNSLLSHAAGLVFATLAFVSALVYVASVFGPIARGLEPHLREHTIRSRERQENDSKDLGLFGILTVASDVALEFLAPVAWGLKAYRASRSFIK